VVGPLSGTCICGSDLWPYRGVEIFTWPSPMGHEYAGIVQEVGREVDGMAVTVELEGAEMDALQQILRRYGGGMDEFESTQLASIVAKIELAGNARGSE
jgi:threonine dehydrogenase-like Zn-dependent dehydrogenase